MQFVPIPRAAFSFLLLFNLCIVGAVESADKVPVTVFVKDSLTAPRLPATIEVKLVSKGVLLEAPLGGEPVELVVNGATAATGMTGGDGRAILSFAPASRSIIPLQVRVGASPRVSAAEGRGNLIVWERRTPVLVVELSALMEEPASTGPLPGIASSFQQESRPMANAADELAKLSQFYYGILYVATVPAGGDAFFVSVEARNWLATHKFPTGLVVPVPAGEDALGAKIDELHEAGWKTIKTGVGRTKAFADAFLRRRLEAILVPEPSKGDAPRKAKVAKDWKEVRKKL